jgi:hypothetical protein
VRWKRARFTSAPRFGPGRFPRAVIPRGPDILGIGRVIYVGGPGEAPPGFVGGTTSLTEWFVYWALDKLLGPEGIDWDYQSGFLGGRHVPGGAVVDFVVYQPVYNIGIRVQTFYFHLAANSYKQFYDFEQKLNLEQNGLRVIDVYEQDFIYDRTGQAVLQVVRDAIAGRERSNPLATGFIIGSF